MEFGIDTVGTCPVRIGVPRTIHFNQEARTVTFTPAMYNAATTPANGGNKYLIAVQAEEYRRVNGVRRLIGRIRHEFVFIVAGCGANAVPNQAQAASQTVNSGTRTTNTADTTRIDVEACNYSRVSLDFTDPNNSGTPTAAQTLTVTMPADVNTNPLLLDSGDVGTFSLRGNNTEHPRGTFYFQPSPTAAGRTVRINVRIEDNNCPIRGRQNRVIVIKVLPKSTRLAIVAAGATGHTPVATIPLGSTLALAGSVLRPDSVRRLATGITVAQIYSYQWTVRGNGLNAAQATNAIITAAPTVTSRYTLAVTPTSGFGPGCGDSASVLVQMGPPLAPPLITSVNGQLSSSYPTGNQWYLNGVLIPGATGQTITPTTSGTYTVVVTQASGGVTYTLPASAAFTVLAAQRALPGTRLSVAPNPTPDGHLTVTLTGYAQPVALTVFDALGRRVASTILATPNPQGSTQELNLHGVGAGMYLLQVRTAASLETRRIMRE